ncbi:alpha/beta hydrolase [Streptomyces broussonetiae]|uniref:Alpha/beta hydrolase fold domain-containing protein n=1 Tax=Streptomyces broussonetiae TaxID=2686304 RepID=A0A6I6MUP1_9ACTN|nr:alpha/beta hydrolase [Streptomyces broussonetiae]QHA02754.1 alpha/beta hydrolase fold domain-containing protein [Streptomyces broussonetiae]
MTSAAPTQLDTGWPPPPFRAPSPAVTGTDGVRHFDGLTYATSPGYRPRLLDVHVPPAEGPVPAVVWIHGGGWLEGDRRCPPPTVPVELLHGTVLDAGLALISVDYRHSLEAPFPAQLHDVKAAIRYVRRHAGELGVDGERIGVWGESAGGHLAALAGLVRADAHGAGLEGNEGVPDETSAVRAVVDWYGVSDIETLVAHPLPPMPGEPSYPNPITTLLGGPEEERQERARAAAPLTYATGATPPPFLLIHGREDQVVPYSQSETLARALTDAGGEVTLRPVEGADHIFLGSAEVPDIVAHSVAFLRRHLTA